MAGPEQKLQVTITVKVPLIALDLETASDFCLSGILIVQFRFQ